MRRIQIGNNVGIFILFFGIALIEAFREGDWLKGTLWLLVGLLFLAGDNIRNRKARNGNKG